MARSSHKSQPVTPQRPLPQRTGHRYSSSQSFYRSPLTPTSPYTPLSLRSFTSSASGGSSTLNTPDADPNSRHLAFSPNVASPSVRANSKDHSLADIAENWRSRANENGIKVSSMNDDSHFGDDEASDRTASDTANDSGFISTEEALLAPSLISDQRGPGFAPLNRPRAHSHLPSPIARSFASPTNTRTPARPLAQPSSPLASRHLSQSQNVNTMSTPPPNRALARQLKLKGSLTDPAATRRREAFGPVWTPSRYNANNMNHTFTLGLNQDTSLDLFDIDENDFENDFEYAHDQEIANDSLMEQRFHSKNHNTFDNNLNTFGYPNYNLPLLPSYGQQQQFFSHSQAPFSDPFHGNAPGSITESVEHYFHTQQQFQDSNMFTPAQNEFLSRPQPWGVASKLSVSPPGINLRDGYTGGPAWVPIPAPSNIATIKGPEIAKPIVMAETKKNPAQDSGCSVCLALSPRTLAVLAPCGHPLCSACLTSALNIVGEKDMECAVCRAKVADFKLISGDGPKIAATMSADERKTPDGDAGRSFMEPLFSSPESNHGRVHGLESAFEFGMGIDNARASTPKREERPNGFREKTDSDGQNGAAACERGGRKGKNDENVVLRIDNVPWDITPPQIQKWLQQPLERVHVLLDKRGKTMSHAYVEVADVAIAGRILRGEAQCEFPHGKPRERGSVLGKGRRARGVTVTRSGQEELMADLFPTWRGSFDGSRPSLAGLDSDQVIGALEGGLIGENEVVGLLHLIREPDLSKFAEFLEPSPSLACPSSHGPGLRARSEPRTPSDREGCDRVSSTVECKKALPATPSSGSDIEDKTALMELAREFGVEAQLVQALAQRLAGLSQG
ncbi:hypothetical protein C0992_001222 [Termitomyces sp. T32_za158]|nr:hypothetical protein C0992_001222 [Termitomyces sp. T32_za158]